MAGRTVEIITGRERRRRWSVEEKLRIVAETQEPGIRITDVAARHGIYPSLLFSWRRQVREGVLSAPVPATFMPVRVMNTAPDEQTEVAPLPTEPKPAGKEETTLGAAPRVGGLIEISLPNGCRLRVDQQVDARALRRIVGALRG